MSERDCENEEREREREREIKGETEREKVYLVHLQMVVITNELL